jgi:hypothetical protein
MTMGNVIAIMCLSAALNLALWGALYYRLRGLPLAVWQVAQRNRVADDSRALDVLQAAAASRLGGLVIGVQTYHEQLAGLARAQAADAEVRARMSERRASDAVTALEAASALVRDLRTLAEDLPSLIDRRAMQTGIALGEAAARKDEGEPSLALAPAPAPEERATVEMPPGAITPETLGKPDRPAPTSQQHALTVPTEQADEDRVSGDEEMTVVQDHLLPSMRTLASAGVTPGGPGVAR